jgi:PAS domain S-box-containing protein
VLSLFLVLLITLLFMSALELVELLIFPDISIWVSHVITILFTAIVFTLAAFFVIRIFQERMHAEEVLRKSEKKFQAIFDQTFQFIGLMSLDGTLIEANKAAIDFVAAERSDVIGKPFWETRWWRHSKEQQEKLRAASVKAAAGELVRYEATHQAADGSIHYIDFSLNPVKNGLGEVIYVIPEGRDITELKRAEENLKRTNRSLRVLSRCNDSVVHASDEAALLQDICHIIVESGRYRMAWVGYAENDRDKTVHVMANAGHDEGYTENVKATWADIERGRGPTGAAIRNQTPYVAHNILTDINFLPWRDEAVKRGYASVIGLPLIADGQAFGALTIYSEMADAFDEDEKTLLKDLADNLAFGIVTLRRELKRVQAEKDLKKNRFILSKAQQIAHVSNWALNLKTNELVWSDEGFRIFGYEPGAIKPTLKLLFSTMHSDDVDRAKMSIDEAVKGNKLYNLDYRIFMKDGSMRYINSVADKLKRDSSGNPEWLYGIHQDITGRKQAEEALRESEERLRLCAATARFGTFDWDILNDRHVWSPETYEIYGLPQGSKITYKNLIRQIYPGDRRDCLIDAGLGPAGRGEISMEYRIIRPSDGAVRWVHIKSRTFFAGEGTERKAIRSLGAIQDITEHKQAEAALNEAKAQAELYVDLMGHDINNLNQVATGYLELAQDMLDLKDNDRVFLDKPMEALQRSSRLIENVRKLQKARSRGVSREVTDLRQVLEDVKDEYDGHANARVILDGDHVVACRILANDLLQDVFANLVDNAIKHSSSKSPLVSIKLDRSTENDQLYYRVSIEDNGPGVPDDLKPRIFTRRLRGSTKAKGSGIGLFLVKTLVEDYRGRVWVEDVVPGDRSKGSRFVVILPAVLS